MAEPIQKDEEGTEIVNVVPVVIDDIRRISRSLKDQAALNEKLSILYASADQQLRTLKQEHAELESMYQKLVDSQRVEQKEETPQASTTN